MFHLAFFQWRFDQEGNLGTKTNEQKKVLVHRWKIKCPKWSIGAALDCVVFRWFSNFIIRWKEDGAF